ncbi:MAG TPA: ABC transporter ATP-binding protein, partial [Arthrobacter sp.]|nr:ABC transporter ATP-binding protein [Arthrobacter sp.]
RFRAMAEAGTTLLVSSHVMEEASRCDGLLLLRGGKLLAQLTPGELSRRGHSSDLEQAFLHIIQEAATAADHATTATETQRSGKPTAGTREPRARTRSVR